MPRKPAARTEEAPEFDPDDEDSPVATDAQVAREVVESHTIEGEPYEPVVYDAADPEARERYVVQVDENGQVLPGQHPDIHDNVETVKMFPGKVFEAQYAEDGSTISVEDRIAHLEEAK